MRKAIEERDNNMTNMKTTVMTDFDYILEQCQQSNHSLGDDKLLKELPTIKLVEILYSSPNDYIGKNGRERSIEFLNIFRLFSY